ncbi:MAG: hypothetical protein WC756_06315 [Taibaiella sp.]|jgi:hypothetical protein
MKKLFVLMLLWLSVAAPCFAQGVMESSVVTDREKPGTQLFHLNPEQYNHHFEFVLPNDGMLKVDFLRLSDWGERNHLKAITAAAANQVKMLKDSFNNNYSTKLLEMNIPMDGKVIALNYQETEKGKRQLAYKDGTHFQLKTSFDTIRVIKNVGIRTKPHTDSGLVQVQYTFILKDINDIMALANDPEAVDKLGNLADETIGKYRNQWNNQNARSHQLNLKYDPVTEKIVKANTDNSSGIFKHIGIYVGVGAIVYSNSISPYFEEGIAFLIPSGTKKLQPFVGVNITAFGFLNTTGNKYNYASYNLEVGYCKKGFAFMPQKSSMMFGLMRKQFSGQNDSYMFHMGFTLAFNSFLSGGFNLASDMKKNSDNAIMAVNFKFNL